MTTATFQIAWPPSRSNPVQTDNQKAKAARFGLLLLTYQLTHAVRHRFGASVADAQFELPSVALNAQLAANIGDSATRYEPGILVPNVPGAVAVENNHNGSIAINVNWIDREEPTNNPDPLVVRIKSG